MVIERFVNLAERRPRATVKHKIKARSLTVRLTTASWHSFNTPGFNFTCPGL